MKSLSQQRSRELVLELENVTKVYRGVSEGSSADAQTRVVALSNVSLAVRRGELVSVIGPSGSGKSTLLHLMGALEVQSSGIVRIDGQDLAALSDDERSRLRRNRIGFVFQFFNLMPQLSALENVMLPALLGGAPSREMRERAKDQLEKVGLGQRMGHRPEALSGGEMQRVAIARALVLDPPLLLADEPTGNLDSRTGEAVIELLLGAATAERTVVLVTHDPRLAALGKRVIRVKDGKVSEENAGLQLEAAALA